MLSHSHAAADCWLLDVTDTNWTIKKPIAIRIDSESNNPQWKNRRHKSLAVTACTGPGSEEVTHLLLCRWKYSTERGGSIEKTAAAYWHFEGSYNTHNDTATFMSLSAFRRRSITEWLTVMLAVISWNQPLEIVVANTGPPLWLMGLTWLLNGNKIITLLFWLKWQDVRMLLSNSRVVDARMDWSRSNLFYLSGMLIKDYTELATGSDSNLRRTCDFTSLY